MGDQKFGDKTLARPWILPFIIVSGLASAYAIPWNYQNVSVLTIVSTVFPLVTQFVLSCLTSVFAFLGKSVWLSLLIATTSISMLNIILFGLNFWSVELPILPKFLIILTSLSLIPTLIWGRKKARYSSPGTVNFEASDSNSDW